MAGLVHHWNPNKTVSKSLRTDLFVSWYITVSHSAWLWYTTTRINSHLQIKNWFPIVTLGESTHACVRHWLAGRRCWRCRWARRAGATPSWWRRSLRWRRRRAACICSPGSRTRPESRWFCWEALINTIHTKFEPFGKEVLCRFHASLGLFKITTYHMERVSESYGWEMCTRKHSDSRRNDIFRVLRAWPSSIISCSSKS